MWEKEKNERGRNERKRNRLVIKKKVWFKMLIYFTNNRRLVQNLLCASAEAGGGLIKQFICVNKFKRKWNLLHGNYIPSTGPVNCALL